MWTSFIAEDILYMLKLDKKTDNYEIYLTNLKKIWSCNLQKDIFIEKFRGCNPLVEIQMEKCLEYALEMLMNIDHGEVFITYFDSGVKLRIKNSLASSKDPKFKIKYELEFIKAEDELFTEIITMPLIQSVILLEKQQNMMKQLLLKKDRELEEYHMEKGAISRTDLITEKFEPEILVTSSKRLMLNIFGKYEDQVAKEYGSIEEKVTEVEVEDWNNVNRKRKRKIYKKGTAQNKITYKCEKPQ